MMIKGYGQFVIGPPGSGKSTYCREMGQLLTSVGRKVALINLDPANETVVYEEALSISDLITVQDVMKYRHLGPNGGLLYSIEYLLENIDWLLTCLKKYNGHYLIFDCPGQIELYTHSEAMKTVIQKLQKSGLSVCTINIIDSHYCNDPGKFISALLVTLSSMLQLELPHINVLSKVDMLKKHSDKLAFNLNFYTEVLDLAYLLECLQENPLTAKYRKLNAALVSLIEDYGLISFLPLYIKDDRLMINLKKAIDKANGFIYNSQEEQCVQTLLSCAVGTQSDNELFGINNDLYTPSSENPD